jgi:hypothetical protein
MWTSDEMGARVFCAQSGHHGMLHAPLDGRLDKLSPAALTWTRNYPMQ